MKLASFTWTLCFLTLALFRQIVCAQEITGSISGVAADPTGAVVPNVKVTVTNINTNVTKTVITGPSGAEPTLIAASRHNF